MKYQPGIQEQMMPQQASRHKADDECVFCGSHNTDRTISGAWVLDASIEDQKVCKECLHSLKDRQPTAWLRWLKRNDPAHWQRVVDHHRLGSSNLSQVIRRIRIE
ncbi:MAG: hypothetical protein H6601_00920 [Flavobacteriales bacterium]|nr:hypothetical protein [Flavobacteriales bacterium]MCB9185289.1 hypothetical protein [Flavobacteriales bacterium]